MGRMIKYLERSCEEFVEYLQLGKEHFFNLIEKTKEKFFNNNITPQPTTTPTQNLSSNFIVNVFKSLLPEPKIENFENNNIIDRLKDIIYKNKEGFMVVEHLNNMYINQKNKEHFGLSEYINKITNNNNVEGLDIVKFFNDIIKNNKSKENFEMINYFTNLLNKQINENNNEHYNSNNIIEYIEKIHYKNINKKKKYKQIIVFLTIIFILSLINLLCHIYKNK